MNRFRHCDVQRVWWQCHVSTRKTTLWPELSAWFFAAFKLDKGREFVSLGMIYMILRRLILRSRAACAASEGGEKESS
jgi:hypothetical protein